MGECRDVPHVGASLRWLRGSPASGRDQGIHLLHLQFSGPRSLVNSAASALRGPRSLEKLRCICAPWAAISRKLHWNRDLRARIPRKLRCVRAPRARIRRKLRCVRAPKAMIPRKLRCARAPRATIPCKLRCARAPRASRGILRVQVPQTLQNKRFA